MIQYRILKTKDSIPYTRELAESVISGLKHWLLQLPDVVEAPHSFGGTEFQVNGRQFMHGHGPKYLDIHLSREDTKRGGWSVTDGYSSREV